MQKTLTRVYHPYWEWEEHKFNMWGKVDNREEYLQKAIKFTGDHELYGSFMQRIIGEWPKSCEHNLSDSAQNRRAWIGHAACALAFQCPEDIVREAWHHLTDLQRELANKQADKAIAQWQTQQTKSPQSQYQNVQKEFLF